MSKEIPQIAGNLMLSEIFEQPNKVKGALNNSLQNIEHIERLLMQATFVVLIGRGSSRAAATYGVNLLRNIAGKIAFQVSPADIAWNLSKLNYSGALVIAISQSGMSTELVAAAKKVISVGAKLLVITNSPNSLLAKLVSDEKDILYCSAGSELAVPATKSYTTTLALLFAVGFASHSHKIEKAIQYLPGAMVDVLQPGESEIEMTGIDGFVLAGEGYAESVAEEGAIKIRETLTTLVSSFETSEFLHGNVNSIRPKNGVIVISGDSFDKGLASQAFIEASKRGARTISIGTSYMEGADQNILVPNLEPEWLPFFSILPLQRAAHDAALKLGLDPDIPRGLTKITQVSEPI